MRTTAFLPVTVRPLTHSLAICLLAGTLSFCKSKSGEAPAAKPAKEMPATHQAAAKAETPPAGQAQAVKDGSGPQSKAVVDSVLKEALSGSLDYNLNLQPFTGGHKQFGEFRGKNLLIFYFSATCPHCQQAFPVVQKLGDELKEKQFATIGVATSGSSPQDIHKFIAEQKGHIPMFHDVKRELARNYGTGFVPVIILVNGEGEFKRFGHFDSLKTVMAIQEQIRRWN